MENKNLKEIKFGEVVTSISKYTKELSSEIIAQIVRRGRTYDLVNVMSGIKYAEKIPVMNSTVVFQAGGTDTTFADAGTVSLSQRTITVCPLKVEEKISLNVLEQYFEGENLDLGSYNDTLSSVFAEAFTNLKSDHISSEIDDVFWFGDVLSGTTANRRKCDGFFKNISTDTTVITGATTATTITSSNAIAIMDDLIRNIPTAVKGDKQKVAFMGMDTFQTLNVAARLANLTHYKPDDLTDPFMAMYLNTDVTMVGMACFDGSNKILISPLWNVIAGCDLKDEQENSFKLFYDEVADNVKFRAKWKQGANCAFPQYLVYKTA
jgi:hypothetical protein